MANVIDALSFELSEEGRKYINYRDMSVQQLGSIYERLIEHEVVREDGEIRVRPNIFARKGSGSYYTPEDLVKLIIDEAIEPLATARLDAFNAKIAELEGSNLPEDLRLGSLKRIDPAGKILELKICDPAMGSGHFLVSLVDYLADQVIAAMAEAEAAVENYISPLSDRIDAIRTTILGNAEDRGWTIDPAQLDDRHVIRRMVLKRCVYGVDKNPMAVELAKVSLWLHTFTVGAPLSFLDHHLRCGDSLFGSWVKGGIDKATAYGSPLLLHDPITRALRAASRMQIIEGLTDAEIAEAHRSADVFAEIEDMTAPLNAFLSLIHAFEWLDIRDRADRLVLRAYFDGTFGDPVRIALGAEPATGRSDDRTRFGEILAEARTLIEEERFLNWQVTFPGIWSDWDSDGLTGGFDAVIGNPPWDRMKLQQVEWFAARRPEIAMAPRAADRQRMIQALEVAEDPLAHEFAKANERAEAAARMARKGGDYPLLSGGDTNINSLFVERAARLSSTGGIVGLLVPSGIATETTSQTFFSGIMAADGVKCVFDFFNKRDTGKLFFTDVYYRFKFCVFVFSPSGHAFGGSRFATFVRNVEELQQEGTVFAMTYAHFQHVNPNTLTAPVYRAARDKEISTDIYDRLPVLADRSTGEEFKALPAKYATMFHMANDSHLFRTRKELEEKEGAYPVSGNVWRSGDGDWVPLYEGKMVQGFDHRASGIVTVAKNMHRQGQAAQTSEPEHQDPTFVPTPRYFIKVEKPLSVQIAVKDVTSTTNARSIISCLLPPYAAGHTLPIIEIEQPDRTRRANMQAFLCANLNSMILDFVARTKILSNHASWYVLEQLPVVPPERYEALRFGPKSAAEIVRDIVLELTYTAHDMAPFARDLGHVDEAGNVKPPFVWDEAHRLHLRARLDAVFFHLYGVTNRDDVRYVYSTFPIVERQETAAHGSYRSRDLCLAYMNALGAGDPDARITM